MHWLVLTQVNKSDSLRVTECSDQWYLEGASFVSTISSMVTRMQYLASPPSFPVARDILPATLSSLE